MLLIAIERVQDALVLAMEAAIRKGLKNVFFVSLDAANIDQFLRTTRSTCSISTSATRGRAKRTLSAA